MKSIVICGSKRFKEEIQSFSRRLRDLGVCVYEPTLHQGADEWAGLSEEYKALVIKGLTLDHFVRKMQLADVVFIFNKDGYIGISTTMEIGYAVGMGKPIYALAPDRDERSRNVLFHGFAQKPQQLVDLLR
jgi:hypothetical protein